MGNVIYMGVDPGEVTGIAFLDRHDRFFGTEVPQDEAIDFIRGIVNVAGNVHIGCERYVQRRRQRLTEQPAAQRITGGVQTLGCTVTLIAPSVAKRMCSDDRLRELGWYTKTKDGHSNDAGRVLLALIALASPRTLRRLIPSTD